MSSNTDVVTPDVFDTWINRSMDLIIKDMLKVIPEDRINDSDNDYFIKPTEEI